jgi:hypothetical protein
MILLTDISVAMINSQSTDVCWRPSGNDAGYRGSDTPTNSRNDRFYDPPLHERKSHRGSVVTKIQPIR